MGKFEITYVFLKSEVHPSLDRSGELDAIRRALEADRGDELFVVHDLMPASIQELRLQLSKRALRVLHISAHGDEAGELYVGNNERISASGLVALLKESCANLSCVVLAACHSTVIAELLHAELGVPAIGAGDKIEESEVTSFAKSLYTGIGEGRTLEDAFATSHAGKAEEAFKLYSQDPRAAVRIRELAHRRRVRRRVGGTLLGLLVAMSLVYGAWMHTRYEQPRSCQAIDAKLDEVWGPKHAQALTALAHFEPGLQAQFDQHRLRAALDDWREQTRYAWRFTCQGAREHDGRASVVEAKLDCFEGVRLHVAQQTNHLLDVSPESFPGLLAELSVQTSQLPSAAVCINAVRPPQNRPARLIQREELSARLSRAHDLASYSQYQSALDELTNLQPRVVALGDETLFAELLAERGRVEHLMGAPSDAERSYQRAMELAERAQHPQLRGRLHLNQALLFTYTKPDPPRAEQHFRAASVIFQAHVMPVVDRAKLRCVEGSLLERAGDLAGAEVSLRQALDMLGDGDDVERLYYLNRLASLLADQGRRSAALWTYWQAIGEAEHAFGRHPKTAMHLYYYYEGALRMGYERDYVAPALAEAIEIWDELDARGERLNDPELVNDARVFHSYFILEDVRRAKMYAERLNRVHPDFAPDAGSNGYVAWYWEAILALDDERPSAALTGARHALSYLARAPEEDPWYARMVMTRYVVLSLVSLAVSSGEPIDEHMHAQIDAAIDAAGLSEQDTQELLVSLQLSEGQAAVLAEIGL